MNLRKIGLSLVVMVAVFGLVGCGKEKFENLSGGTEAIVKDEIKKEREAIVGVKENEEEIKILKVLNLTCKNDRKGVENKTVNEVNTDRREWKYCKNDNYHYEFRYSESNLNMLGERVVEGGSEGNPSFEFKDSGHFAIAIWDNPNNKTARESLNENYAEYSGGWGWDFEKVKLGNKDIFRAVRDDFCHTEYDMYPRMNEMVVFRIEVCDKDKKKKNVANFREVVNSFGNISEK